MLPRLPLTFPPSPCVSDAAAPSLAFDSVPSTAFAARQAFSTRDDVYCVNLACLAIVDQAQPRLSTTSPSCRSSPYPTGRALRNPAPPAVPRRALTSLSVPFLRRHTWPFLTPPRRATRLLPDRSPSVHAQPRRCGRAVRALPRASPQRLSPSSQRCPASSSITSLSSPSLCCRAELIRPSDSSPSLSAAARPSLAKRPLPDGPSTRHSCLASTG